MFKRWWMSVSVGRISGRSCIEISPGPCRSEPHKEEVIRLSFFFPVNFLPSSTHTVQHDPHLSDRYGRPSFR